MKQDEAIEELSVIFEDYTHNLINKINSIEMLWNDLDKHWDADKLRELYRSVHNLRHSSSTYCYHALHESAYKLELKLQSIRSGTELNHEKENIFHGINTLKQSFLSTSSDDALENFLTLNTNDLA